MKKNNEIKNLCEWFKSKEAKEVFRKYQAIEEKRFSETETEEEEQNEEVTEEIATTEVKEVEEMEEMEADHIEEFIKSVVVSMKDAEIQVDVYEALDDGYINTLWVLFIKEKDYNKVKEFFNHLGLRIKVYNKIKLREKYYEKQSNI